MENAIDTPEGYTDRIRQELGNCLTETNLSHGEKFIGKVRDRYDLVDRLALITTDRQSAFDRVLAAIPFKGQVLNLTSAWWFEQTRHNRAESRAIHTRSKRHDRQDMHRVSDRVRGAWIHHWNHEHRALDGIPEW